MHGYIPCEAILSSQIQVYDTYTAAIYICKCSVVYFLKAKVAESSVTTCLIGIVFNQCDDFAHSVTDDEDDEIVNRFELVAVAAIIATFAVVLLLATCLLVTLLNRFAAGGAVVYEFEQAKSISPATAVRASRAGVEDVPLSQVSHNLMSKV